MKATFLSTLVLCIYWGWVPVFIVHMVLNNTIYRNIGKEEFEYTRYRNKKTDDLLLCFFTFRWNKTFQEHNDPMTTRLMKISNVISIVFGIYTMAILLLWMFTYGKKF